MTTTPDSPRRTWPQRQFRLDDQTMKEVRVRLAMDEEKYQSVVESLLRGWLAGKIDLSAVRAATEESTKK